jgi:hypothetical protein
MNFEEKVQANVYGKVMLQHMTCRTTAAHAVSAKHNEHCLDSIGQQSVCYVALYRSRLHFYPFSTAAYSVAIPEALPSIVR